MANKIRLLILISLESFFLVILTVFLVVKKIKPDNKKILTPQIGVKYIINKNSQGIKYIVDKNHKVIATVEFGSPNLDDLKSRGEFVVISDKKIPLKEAEYKDGKIVRHIPTKSEIIAKKKTEIERIENQIIKLEVEKEKARELKMIEIAKNKQKVIDDLNIQLRKIRKELEKLEQ